MKMVTPLNDSEVTHRTWNGRDDIHQHYIGHFSASEHVMTLALAWKREKDAPLFPVGRFRFDMPALVEAGFARKHGAEYVVRFQRTGSLIEVARNRSSDALKIGRLPERYFTE